jgi:AdoMet-dependent rRNA methyltransferase SPB1
MAERSLTSDEQMKHFRNNIPVTKEAVQAIRAKARALNARPIKKVAEAKARKKMRTAKRLAKMQKKADVINEGDMTEREKAASIAKVLSKASKEPKSKKREVRVVVAKGANRGIKGRPTGTKGRYKVSADASVAAQT